MTKLAHLYIWTLTLLVAHQIDSAYWREWDLFGIPGGVQVFVLLNVPLALLFLYGLVRVAQAPRRGAPFALGLSLVGVGAFFIHLWFLWQGHLEFRVPTSLAVLCATFLASLALGWRSMEILRKPRPQ
jgi:hypothetical protein